MIIGGGFAGLNAAKMLGRAEDVEVTIIDRENYHLFQPLLYQVAMAGLSPAEIAVPLRSILRRYQNIQILKGKAYSVDLKQKKVMTNIGDQSFDYLILACGVRHTYFGHDEWEEYAPGLKTIAQATELRRRILTAFEKAEVERDPKEKMRLLSFVVVGGGTTGVELAGALGEMKRYFLARDYKRLDPELSQVTIVEAGPRLLPTFSNKLANRAAKDLDNLGVTVLTSMRITHIDSTGVEVGGKKIPAATVLWAAGVKASSLNLQLGGQLDELRRIRVEPDLSLKGHPNVFVAGDQAHFSRQNGKPLPGLAPVALQQGRFIAKNILRETNGIPRKEFRYKEKGQMATIGRSCAILELDGVKLSGFLAWITWLFVHIYYLIGFKNRVFVLLQWSMAYLTFRKGARLIVDKEWRFFSPG